MKSTFLISLCLVIAQTSLSQTCNTSIPESTPDSRFIVDGEEVTDIVTGLIWQRCPLGQAGSDCSDGGYVFYTWQEALKAAASWATEDKAWRLPNINELRSIVEERCYNPAINLSVFPFPYYATFWSGSPSAYSPDGAWDVNFYFGFSTYGTKDNERYIRLVRDEQ